MAHSEREKKPEVKLSPAQFEEFYNNIIRNLSILNGLCIQGGISEQTDSLLKSVLTYGEMAEESRANGLILYEDDFKELVMLTRYFREFTNRIKYRGMVDEKLSRKCGETADYLDGIIPKEYTAAVPGR